MFLIRRRRLEKNGRSRLLREVKVVPQVSQNSGILSYIGTIIWPSICKRIEPLTSKKYIFDKFGVGIVT